MKEQLLIDIINSKKEKLNKSKLNVDFVKNLDAWLRMELTYSSNAIEGNTLTRQETALVVNDHMTVAGKDINEILEILNHEKAISYILDLSKKIKVKDITEDIILNIHNILLSNIDSNNAGKYRSVPVRISASLMIPPNHLKVKSMMTKLVELIQEPNVDPVIIAVNAHHELVSIHPFVDGNGRTARLLLNLILLINNYPFVYIAKEERSQYLQSLEKSQIGGTKDDYYHLMLKSIERSLDKYLILDLENTKNITYKIGELSKISNVPVSTIRYWLGEGLIKTFNLTKSGYAIFDNNSIARIEHIQKLKLEKRMTIEEIKKLII